MVGAPFGFFVRHLEVAMPTAKFFLDKELTQEAPNMTFEAIEPAQVEGSIRWGDDGRRYRLERVGVDENGNVILDPVLVGDA